MKLSDPFHKWLDEETSECDSLHRDLFTAANYLIEQGREDEQIFDLMRESCNKVPDRNVPDREIKSAIRCARLYKKGEIETSDWPRPNKDLQQQIIDYYSEIDLVSEAKHIATETNQDPDFYLRELFDEGELVCLGLEMNRPVTITREEAIDYVQSFAIPYIVPSPMVSLDGMTEDGEISPRTKANTGKRRFLVVEFDYSDSNSQLAFHFWLNSFIPCCFIVYSGGKSFHGWYYVEPLAEPEVKGFFEKAVKIGADRVTWSKCQLCRLPAGKNIKSKKKQTVIGRSLFDVAE